MVFDKDKALWVQESDTVEVVRCAKCKWYDTENEICKFWHGVRYPEHYCGEGERKDNG